MEGVSGVQQDLSGIMPGHLDMPRVYLAVSIDCECDKGPGWRLKKPIAFDGVVRGIGQKLQPLFRKRRAKPTYLLSPEVLRDEACVRTLRTLDGDAELGTHLHGELVDPGAFEPDVTSAFQRDYERGVEQAKLQTLTDLFVSAFGERPRSFRAGRFGIGKNSLELLDALGYVVDSSVTPFMDWGPNGAPGLSFVGAPTQPYRPNARAPHLEGDCRLLEVPVTIRPHWLNQIPWVGRLREPRWLRPTRGAAGDLERVARDEIAAATSAERPRQAIVLNAMFHNVEIVAGASPYASDEGAADAILGRLDALLAFAERESISVVGLSDIPGIVGPSQERSREGAAARLDR